MKSILIALSLSLAATAHAAFEVSWYSVDGGGHMSMAGGNFELAGTAGQADAGESAGGNFAVVGGFWAAALPAGVPAPNVIAAVSRKSCDLPLTLSGPAVSEARQGGITQVCFSYDDAAPSAIVTVVEDASCPSPPAYDLYSGAAVVSCAPTGSELCCTFTPGLENARAYRLSVVSGSGAATVEIRGLAGDVNSDGRVNGTDRSVIVGAWTGGGYSCPTDLNGDAATNGTDRSVVVGAWTGAENCAP